MSRLTAFAVNLCLAGCGAATSADSTPFGGVGGEVVTGHSTSSSSSSTTTTTATTFGSISSSTSSDVSSSSTSLDTAVSTTEPIPDFGDGAPAGCKGKIDVIFAISTEYPMKDFQPRLIAAFPEFAQALEDELGAFDLHILVTDSSHVWGMNDCSICQNPDDCDPTGEPSLCGAKLDACDTTMGSGETFSSGIGSSGRRCALAGGHRYITSDEEDLVGAFTCLARVGYGVATPQPFDSVLAAVGQPLLESTVELNGPGGCNEGFLRDDALLLLVIIQTAYEQHSLGGPYQWRKALYAAKGNDEDAVFALAITTDGDLSPSLCFPGNPPGPPNRMRAFMEEYLAHGRIESICAPSYGTFLKEVAAELVPLCDQFIPQ